MKLRTFALVCQTFGLIFLTASILGYRHKGNVLETQLEQFNVRVTEHHHILHKDCDVHVGHVPAGVEIIVTNID